MCYAPLRDHPRHVTAALEQLAEAALGRLRVPLGGDQDIEHVAMLIHGSPEIVSRAVNLAKDFIAVPLVARLGSTAPQLVSVAVAELAALLADGFVGHMNTASREQFFYVAVAERETEIEPNGVRDNLDRVAVALVQVRSSRWGHARIIYEAATACLPALGLT